MSGMSYHEVIAVLHGDRPIKVREEDVLGILKRPFHGCQIVGGGRHLEGSVSSSNKSIEKAKMLVKGSMANRLLLIYVSGQSQSTL